MADNSRSNRRPLSLNDSLLRNLSAPHRPSLTQERMGERKKSVVRLEGRRRLCKPFSKENDPFNLTGVEDFDDLPTVQEEMNQLNFETEGKPGLCKVSSEDGGNMYNKVIADEPMFFGITDFDSPSPRPWMEDDSHYNATAAVEELNQLNVETDSKPGHCNVSSREDDYTCNTVRSDEPTLVGITDFDSPPSRLNIQNERHNKDTEEGKVSSRDDGNTGNKVVANEPNFFGITDFISPSPQSTIEDKSHYNDKVKEDVVQLKVKMESKPELCKVLSLDEDNSCNKVVGDNLKVFNMTNLNSPSPRPKIEDDIHDNDPGANEVQNILNDLSSRLKFFSIEKRKSPEKDNPVNNSHDLVKYPLDNEKKHELREYGSAQSSFSREDLPDPSGSLPTNRVEDLHDPFASSSDTSNKVTAVPDPSDSSSDMTNEFIDRPVPLRYSSDMTNKVEIPAEIFLHELDKEEGNLPSQAKGQNFVHWENRTEDIRVGKSRKGSSSNGENLRPFGHTFDPSVEDKEKDDPSFKSEGTSFAHRMYETRPFGHTFESNVEDNENNDPSFESEGTSFAHHIYETNKNSPSGNKRVANRPNEKSRSVGRSCVHQLRDDSDDDCRILTGEKVVQVMRRTEESKKSRRACAIALDNYEDTLVEYDEDTITLTSPKYTCTLPGKVAKMLYPHQREGLKWLWSLHCQGKGGILGDDMGLGKTMQICSFLAGLFNSKLIKRALVVAPKTLLSHWIKELSVVGLSAKTREYYGNCSKAREYELRDILEDKGILLTTYDTARNNSKSLRGDHCRRYFDDDEDEDSPTWDYMILDEGHLIKNPNTQRAKSLLEIPSAHRIIISGTPIQNNLKELWALFNFSCPGLLGDYKWFKDTYEQSILRGNEKNASDRQKDTGSKVAKELRQQIQPYFLRRLKDDVFSKDDSTTCKLSKKNEIIVWLRLTAYQRQLYEAFLQSRVVHSAFDGSPLAALTILKKICDHPLILTKRAAEDVLEGWDSLNSQLNPEEAAMAEKLAMHIADISGTDDIQENHDNISCKVSFIMSLLDNLIPEGHHVLIFSQTRKMLNFIQESLISNGYKFLRLDGTTKASDRVAVVNDFQEGLSQAPIFLLTSQVGGLGLTLTKADRVIVVDPAWNPSTDNQSVDRAYRIGQDKDVIVYRLMTCATVEEKIYRKQIFKGGLFRTATEHKEQTRYFSRQDLRELFSIPTQGFDVSLTQQQLHEEHDSQHKMDEALKSHIRFLEANGIAGISHHSLLFSKTAPVQVIHEEEEEIRHRTKKGISFARHASSSYLGEPTTFDALCHEQPLPVSDGKLTEGEIKQRINSLWQKLSDKTLVSRLPDKGAKLQNSIAELDWELQKLKMAKKERQVVDLDDITRNFDSVLNV